MVAANQPSIRPQMARVPALTTLFHALAAGDLRRARALAEGIAVSEEKAGRKEAAEKLRSALASVPSAPEAPPLRPAALPDILAPVASTTRLADVELSAATRAAVQEVLNEHRHRDALQAHDLRPRSRLFFHGPPGCGKTMTAQALAGEMGLPLYVVRFDALIGAYLGQTALRVRECFRFAETTPCLLLVDEVDALGRKRGKVTDIGELDRVLISVMQQLDLTVPAGLIIAASNVPDDLDPALLRRFDASLAFPAPERAVLARFARTEATKRGIKLVNGFKHELGQAQTFADVRHAVDDEHRRIILRGM